MKRLLLPAVISAIIMSEASANAFTISDIRLDGLQRVSAGSVFAALPLEVGSQIDERGLVEATQALFRTGFFHDIQLSREDDVLLVELVERPSISALTITGNKAINTEDLLKGLQQSGLADGEIFQRATLEGVRNELHRQYVAQGRYDAEIEARVVEQERNRVAIEIDIKEGSVASIRHVNIVGNQAFSNEELTGIFELGERDWLSFFRGNDKYSREKLSGDLERLRAYYLDRGYINMDISSTQVSITPDKKHVYITVNVDEGQQYRISDIKLSGELIVAEEEVTALMLTEQGQVFSRRIMTGTSDLITRRLGNEGYTFASVTGIPEVNEEDNTVSITYFVEPGKRAYVNRISFRGNTKTRDEVLRREMRQMEGGWASTYLIEQSKTRLDRLGFFREVNVETPAVAGTDDQIDVNISVEEQPSGSISASVGYAQNAGLILGGSISQSNFMGTGNYVSLGLTRSDYQSYYGFNFVNPYWTIDGVSLGWNAFFRETDYSDLNYDFSSYSVDSYGAGVTLGYPISEQSRLTFGLRLQSDSIDEGSIPAKEISKFIADEGEDHLVLRASAGWSTSTLNRGVFPTRGHSQGISADVAVPGSDLTFFSLDYNGQFYKRLSDSNVLRFHTQLGYADGYGSTNALPFYEHYYAGGFGSVRGIRDSTLGPRSTPHDNDWDPEYLPFGGNVLIQGGVELVFPTPFIKDQRSLRSYAFVDAGNVFNTNCSREQERRSETGCDIDPSDLAVTAGVGLTWITAMGPLNFAVGTTLNKPDNAKTQIFQFTLGQTF